MFDYTSLPMNCCLSKPILCCFSCLQKNFLLLVYNLVLLYKLKINFLFSKPYSIPLYLCRLEYSEQGPPGEIQDPPSKSLERPSPLQYKKLYMITSMQHAGSQRESRCLEDSVSCGYLPCLDRYFLFFYLN
jgi:hypothetical protein